MEGGQGKEVEEGGVQEETTEELSVQLKEISEEIKYSLPGGCMCKICGRLLADRRSLKGHQASNKVCLAKQGQDPLLTVSAADEKEAAEEKRIGVSEGLPFQLKGFPEGFTPSLSTTFECAFCGRVLVGMRGLKGHQMSNKACLAKQAERSKSKVHSPTLEPAKQVGPEEVGDPQSAISTLRFVENSVPTGQTCEFCSRIFPSNQTMKYHQITNKPCLAVQEQKRGVVSEENGDNGSNFVADDEIIHLDSTAMDLKGNLAKHFSDLKNLLTSEECDFCKRRFASKLILKFHQKSNASCLALQPKRKLAEVSNVNVDSDVAEVGLEMSIISVPFLTETQQNKKLACQFCGRQMWSKAALDLHQRRNIACCNIQGRTPEPTPPDEDVNVEPAMDELLERPTEGAADGPAGAWGIDGGGDGAPIGTWTRMKPDDLAVCGCPRMCPGKRKEKHPRVHVRVLVESAEKGQWRTYRRQGEEFHRQFPYAIMAKGGLELWTAGHGGETAGKGLRWELGQRQRLVQVVRVTAERGNGGRSLCGAAQVQVKVRAPSGDGAEATLYLRLCTAQFAWGWDKEGLFNASTRQTNSLPRKLFCQRCGCKTEWQFKKGEVRLPKESFTGRVELLHCGEAWLQVQWQEISAMVPLGSACNPNGAPHFVSRGPNPSELPLTHTTPSKWAAALVLLRRAVPAGAYIDPRNELADNWPGVYPAARRCAVCEAPDEEHRRTCLALLFDPDPAPPPPDSVSSASAEQKPCCQWPTCCTRPQPTEPDEEDEEPDEEDEEPEDPPDNEPDDPLPQPRPCCWTLFPPGDVSPNAKVYRLKYHVIMGFVMALALLLAVILYDNAEIFAAIAVFALEMLLERITYIIDNNAPKLNAKWGGMLSESRTLPFFPIWIGVGHVVAPSILLGVVLETSGLFAIGAAATLSVQFFIPTDFTAQNITVTVTEQNITATVGGKQAPQSVLVVWAIAALLFVRYVRVMKKFPKKGEKGAKEANEFVNKRLKEEEHKKGRPLEDKEKKELQVQFQNEWRDSEDRVKEAKEYIDTKVKEQVEEAKARGEELLEEKQQELRQKFEEEVTRKLERQARKFFKDSELPVNLTCMDLIQGSSEEDTEVFDDEPEEKPEEEPEEEEGDDEPESKSQGAADKLSENWDRLSRSIEFFNLLVGVAVTAILCLLHAYFKPDGGTMKGFHPITDTRGYSKDETFAEVKTWLVLLYSASFRSLHAAVNKTKLDKALFNSGENGIQEALRDLWVATKELFRLPLPKDESDTDRRILEYQQIAGQRLKVKRDEAVAALPEDRRPKVVSVPVIPQRALFACLVVLRFLQLLRTASDEEASVEDGMMSNIWIEVALLLFVILVSSAFGLAWDIFRLNQWGELRIVVDHALAECYMAGTSNSPRFPKVTFSSAPLPHTDDENDRNNPLALVARCEVWHRPDGDRAQREERLVQLVEADVKVDQEAYKDWCASVQFMVTVEASVFASTPQGGSRKEPLQRRLYVRLCRSRVTCGWDKEEVFRADTAYTDGVWRCRRCRKRTEWGVVERHYKRDKAMAEAAAEKEDRGCGASDWLAICCPPAAGPGQSADPDESQERVIMLPIPSDQEPQAPDPRAPFVQRPDQQDEGPPRYVWKRHPRDEEERRQLPCVVIPHCGEAYIKINWFAIALGARNEDLKVKTVYLQIGGLCDDNFSPKFFESGFPIPDGWQITTVAGGKHSMNQDGSDIEPRPFMNQGGSDEPKAACCPRCELLRKYSGFNASRLRLEGPPRPELKLQPDPDSDGNGAEVVQLLAAKVTTDEKLRACRSFVLDVTTQDPNGQAAADVKKLYLKLCGPSVLASYSESGVKTKASSFFGTGIEECQRCGSFTEKSIVAFNALSSPDTAPDPPRPVSVQLRGCGTCWLELEADGEVERHWKRRFLNIGLSHAGTGHGHAGAGQHGQHTVVDIGVSGKDFGGGEDPGREEAAPTAERAGGAAASRPRKRFFGFLRGGGHGREPQQPEGAQSEPAVPGPSAGTVVTGPVGQPERVPPPPEARIDLVANSLIRCTGGKLHMPELLSVTDAPRLASPPGHVNLSDQCAVCRGTGKQFLRSLEAELKVQFEPRDSEVPDFDASGGGQSVRGLQLTKVAEQLWLVRECLDLVEVHGNTLCQRSHSGACEPSLVKVARQRREGLLRFLTAYFQHRAATTAESSALRFADFEPHQARGCRPRCERTASVMLFPKSLRIDMPEPASELEPQTGSRGTPVDTVSAELGVVDTEVKPADALRQSESEASPSREHHDGQVADIAMQMAHAPIPSTLDLPGQNGGGGAPVSPGARLRSVQNDAARKRTNETDDVEEGGGGREWGGSEKEQKGGVGAGVFGKAEREDEDKKWTAGWRGGLENEEESGVGGESFGSLDLQLDTRSGRSGQQLPAGDTAAVPDQQTQEHSRGLLSDALEQSRSGDAELGSDVLDPGVTSVLLRDTVFPTLEDEDEDAKIDVEAGGEGREWGGSEEKQEGWVGAGVFGKAESEDEDKKWRG